ncbi:class I SAM-dependent methyltransferase [Streptomyces sp. NPDC058382]|uniref:class I SAM-dependent methyltransferase n=1 Tax=unclassified Streptomyces TaxID=2593676 RepID=UPI00362683AA
MTRDKNWGSGMAEAVDEGTGVNEAVGRTALMVAAARAIEAGRPDALARDELAEHFVRAARASADWPVHLDQVPGRDDDPLWGRLGRFFGLRTRVFDDFLLDRTAAGIDQVVILGAGLDSRAYRLPWPPGCTVFEIDQEGVLSFKQAVLDTLDTAPRSERRPLAADLRLDWAGTLLTAGFDPARPTAWVAEGLLPYPPPGAERELITTIVAHSARGSAIGYEVKHGVKPAPLTDYPLHTAARERIGVDLSALFNADPRPDSAGDLAARGWSTTVRTPFDFTRQYGRGPLPEKDDSLAANQWIFATLLPA